MSPPLMPKYTELLARRAKAEEARKGTWTDRAEEVVLAWIADAEDDLKACVQNNSLDADVFAESIFYHTRILNWVRARRDR